MDRSEQRPRFPGQVATEPHNAEATDRHAADGHAAIFAPYNAPVSLPQPGPTIGHQIGATINIAVSYTLDGAQASAAANSVHKFELIRSIAGVVACIAGLTVVNSLDGGAAVTIAGNIILSVTLFVVLVCAVRWLIIAARVRKTAPKSTRPTTVAITDAGLTVNRAGAVVAKVPWKDVAHCTSADDIWIFALKGGKDAVLIPQQLLAPSDREQVGAFLGTWSKLRYRFIPW